MSSSEITTHGVHVRAEPQHRPDLSEPGRWVFQYTIHITNLNDRPVRLLARHWIITDGEGRSEEVRGLAVVGHQPLLKPGESFEYSSWTRIATPHGSMHGTFFCMTEDARPFDSPVPEFALAVASTLH